MDLLRHPYEATQLQIRIDHSILDPLARFSMRGPAVLAVTNLEFAKVLQIWTDTDHRIRRSAAISSSAIWQQKRQTIRTPFYLLLLASSLVRSISKARWKRNRVLHHRLQEELPRPKWQSSLFLDHTRRKMSGSSHRWKNIKTQPWLILQWWVLAGNQHSSIRLPKSWTPLNIFASATLSLMLFSITRFEILFCLDHKNWLWKGGYFLSWRFRSCVAAFRFELNRQHTFVNLFIHLHNLVGISFIGRAHFVWTQKANCESLSELRLLGSRSTRKIRNWCNLWAI